MKNILEETKRLAGEIKPPVSMLCEDANVTVRWYNKLLAGEIKDPGINRITRLYETLLKYKRIQGHEPTNSHS